MAAWHDRGAVEVNLAMYRTWFDDFVYLQDTGSVIDDLPVYRQMQQDARFFGIESELSLPVWRRGAKTLLASVGGDYTRATLDDGSPVPRIPPLSLLGALEFQSPGGRRGPSCSGWTIRSGSPPTRL